MKRPPNRLVPPCAKPYKRHAFPKHKRRAPDYIGEPRACIHPGCGQGQVAGKAPQRANSEYLWYWWRGIGDFMDRRHRQRRNGPRP